MLIKSSFALQDGWFFVLAALYFLPSALQYSTLALEQVRICFSPLFVSYWLNVLIFPVYNDGRRSSKCNWITAKELTYQEKSASVLLMK
jgi:hypothetical protein